MISSNSIQYMSRQAIKDTLEPLTVLELRDFLDRLIMGGCSNFRIITPDRKITGGSTHYTLNGHNRTVKLEDLSPCL